MTDMAKLTDKLNAHEDAFDRKRKSDNTGDWGDWYLHMVVFPSLKDIAERIDSIEERMSKREKARGCAGATT